MSENSNDKEEEKFLSLELQYADIVQLVSSNPYINQEIYFVDYIDTDLLLLKLAPLSNYNRPPLELNLIRDTITSSQPRILIDSKEITSIHLMSRSPPEKRGYIRQNGFREKQVLSLEWKDADKQNVIVQQIVPEYDAMEVMEPISKEVYYLDFGFKGLLLFFRRIRIVQESKIPTPTTAFEEEGVEEGVEGYDRQDWDTDVALSRLTLDGDQFMHENIDHDTDDNVYEQDRPTFPAQIRDFSDTLYAQKPSCTLEEEMEIIKTLNRFTELRHLFSQWQEDGTVCPKRADEQPLLQAITTNQQSIGLKWIYPVMGLTRRVTLSKDEQKQDAFLDNSCFQPETDDKSKHMEKWTDYMNPTIKDKFNELIRSRLVSPFLSIKNSDMELEAISYPVETIQEICVNQSKKNNPVANSFVQVFKKRTAIRSDDTFSIERLVPRIDKEDDGRKNKDVVGIRSLLVLSLDTMKQSSLFLPKTLLYRKCHMHTSFPYALPAVSHTEEIAEGANPLWKVYKPTLVNVRQTPLPKFGQQPIHYVPTTTIEKYSQLLQLAVPNSTYITDWLHHSDDWFQKCFSIAEVVNSLETFAVNYDNLRLGLFQKMRNMVRDNIRAFLTQSQDMAENLAAAATISSRQPKANWSLFFEKSSLAVEQLQSLSKGYIDNEIATSSEKLWDTIQQDRGKLLALTILYMASDQLTSNQYLDQKEIDFSVDEQEKRPLADKLVLKKYANEKNLKDDNNQQIFADADLLPAELKQYLENAAPLDFHGDETERDKAIEIHLREKYQMTDTDKIRETTELLVHKGRIIQDGDYAVLLVKPTNAAINSRKQTGNAFVSNNEYETRQYYKRIQNIWVEQIDMKDEQIQNLLALVQQLKSKTASQREKQQAKSLLGQQYAQQVDRLREPLQEQIQRQVKWLEQQREINQQRKLMWNHAATMLAQTPLPTVSISPYVVLRDAVLAITDESSRFQHIQKFYESQCRQAVPGEDQQWGYCIETNTKLFPKALYELAAVYEDADTYKKLFDELCRQQRITKVENTFYLENYAVPPGYGESNRVEDSFEFYNRINEYENQKEEELQQIVDMLDQVKKEKKSDKNMMFMIFKQFNQLVGLPERDEKLYSEMLLVFYKSGTIIQKGLLNLETKMKKNKANKEEIGKTKIAFRKREEIMFAVAAYYIIAQLHSDELRPTIHSNCAYSLEGYPANADETQLSGIAFISCLLKASVTDEMEPWGALFPDDFKIESIRNRVSTLLKNDADLMGKIHQRRHYLSQRELRKQMAQTDETGQVKWSQFLPPLVVYNDILSPNTKVSNEQIKMLQQEWIHGGIKRPELLTLKKYTNMLAMFLNAAVQKVVHEKYIHGAKNNPSFYLSTMCCDEHPKDRKLQNMYLDPLYYFSQNEPQIKVLVNQSEILFQLTKISHMLGTAGFVFYSMPPVFAVQNKPTLQVDIMKKILKKYGHQDLETHPENSRDLYQKVEKLVPKTPIVHINPDEDNNGGDTALLNFLTPKLTGDNAILRNLQTYLENRSDEALNTLKISMKNPERSLVSHWPQINSWKKWLLAEWPTEEMKSLAYENALETIQVLIPAQILSKNAMSNPYLIISKHFEFSETHNTLLNKKLNENRMAFDKYCRDAVFCQYIQGVVEKHRETFIPLYKLLAKSTLTKDLIQDIHRYIVMDVLLEYIEELEDKSEDQSDKGESDDDEDESDEDQSHEDQEKVSKKQVFEYLDTLANALLTVHSTISMPYATIIEKTRNDTSSERNSVIQRLDEMSDEKRKVEMITKGLKLGDWQVGNEVFKYNRNQFDKEMGGQAAMTDDREEEGYDQNDYDNEEDEEGDDNKYENE